MKAFLASAVVAVGPETRRFKVGDEAFGRAGTNRIGTLAERIAVAETDLAVPGGQSADGRR